MKLIALRDSGQGNSTQRVRRPGVFRDGIVGDKPAPKSRSLSEIAKCEELF
jgi:hypothetical protein